MFSDDRNKARFTDEDLSRAKITETIDMRGASFDGSLYADISERESALASGPLPAPERRGRKRTLARHVFT
jgi:hypothetical protein